MELNTPQVWTGRTQIKPREKGDNHKPKRDHQRLAKSKVHEVYTYYDSHYWNDAFDGDICSLEWERRVMSWVSSNNSEIYPRDSNILEDFQFGPFFVKHPVSAFSLWNVLTTIYNLDQTICGNIKYRWEQIEYRPFRYLGDEDILNSWTRSLEDLKVQLKRTDEDAKWESKMYDILRGVENYENFFHALKQVLEVQTNLEPEEAAVLIERIERDVGRRLVLIDQVLTFEDDDVVVDLELVQQSRAKKSSHVDSGVEFNDDSPSSSPIWQERGSILSARDNEEVSRAAMNPHDLVSSIAIGPQLNDIPDVMELDSKPRSKKHPKGGIRYVREPLDYCRQPVWDLGNWMKGRYTKVRSLSPVHRKSKEKVSPTNTWRSDESHSTVVSVGVQTDE